MQSTMLFIDLLGAACMLLFGLRFLKKGVNLAFGAQLRMFMAASTRNRVVAFFAGLGTTLALQSSTAMALMISSFAAQGLIKPVMAQAVMLGANVGTSLVTQILSLDLHWLASVAFIAGLLASSRKSRRSRGLGEAVIGLALMMFSLQLLSQATGPIRDSAAVSAFFALLGDAPIVAILLSAILAAASASSLAVVLFVAALAGAGSVEPGVCLLLVAGANLGGAIPPLLATTADGIVGRRVVITNLLVRGLGAVMVLAAVPWLSDVAAQYASPVRLVVDAHVGFNLLLAIVFLPLIGPLTRLVAIMVPDKRSASDTGPRHLDEDALSNLPSALAAATRETLRIGDKVEHMLRVTLQALKADDELLCQSVSDLDDQVDELQRAVKLYLARLDRTALAADGLRQADAILDYAVNLEHVGDIVERSLSRMTLKKIERQLEFSPEGFAEIETLFLSTLENVQLAQTVFLSGDAQLARRLMETKVSIRHQERDSASRHMVRLNQGKPSTIQTSEIHLDILRDLKRINAHLVSVAHPILDQAGMLRESRLRKTAGS